MDKKTASDFVEWMSRHIVVMCGTYFRLGKDGKPDSDQHTYKAILSERSISYR